MMVIKLVIKKKKKENTTTTTVVKLTKKGKISTAGRRRSRGYAWEYKIVKFVEEFHLSKPKEKQDENKWYIRRLGGSSTGLPDLVCTNNFLSRILTIEAKSTFESQVYIPSDQIIRCFEITEMFGVYEERFVIFAFKFSKNVKEGRPQLKTYLFKVINANLKEICYALNWVKCTYNGDLYFNMKDNNNSLLQLKVRRYKSLKELVQGKERQTTLPYIINQEEEDSD